MDLIQHGNSPKRTAGQKRAGKPNLRIHPFVDAAMHRLVDQLYIKGSLPAAFVHSVLREAVDRLRVLHPDLATVLVVPSASTVRRLAARRWAVYCNYRGS